MANASMSCETLAQHLHIAAEQYERDAQVMTAEHGVPLLTTAQVQRRLSEQFKRQAAECRAFADALSDVRSIGFDDKDRIEIETIGA